jgi:hypothetical protein
MALGSIALALAAVAGAPDAGRGGVPIKYTVRFVEADGVGWREAVFTRLTPVTRQGAATVWTAPHDVAKRLVQQATKNPSAHMVQAPTVIAWSGSPAHITTRANHQLVTQAAWSGDDHSVEARPETVRTGSATTVMGRRLDQGILVQMVLQDTQIIAVHRVALDGPAGPKTSPVTKKADYPAEECEKAPGCCQAGESTKKSTTTKVTFRWEWNLGGGQLPTGRYMHDDVQYFPSGPEFPFSNIPGTTEPAKMCANGIEPAPAPAPKSTSGVTAASAPATACCSSSLACTSCCKEDEAGKVAVEVPEIGREEIAGEWLIPNDGILLVSFGPHTVADKDGKAVLRERLAIVEAEETDVEAVPPPGPGMIGVPFVVPMPPGYGPAFLPQPLPAPSAYGPAPGSMMPAPLGEPGTPPPGPAPALALPDGPPEMPMPPVPMPPMPSRSIPQGYHSDGKAADLPPLPPEEEDDDDAASRSAEPRPSPQMKKPRQADPATDAKLRSTGDSAMKKAQFVAPSFPAIPSIFQPAPTVGLQFLIPIKPFYLRLPFNRRLELEIYGRVVRNPEPATGSAELATKPANDGASAR